MKLKKCFFIHMEQHNNPYHGNYRKTLAQYQALQEIFTVKLIYQGVSFSNKWLRLLNGSVIVPLWLGRQLWINPGSVVYYRYYPQYFMLHWILYFLRKRALLFVEINTKNREEFKLTNKILYFLNFLGEKIAYKAAAAVLPVTPELGDYVRSIEPHCRTRALGNGYDPLASDLTAAEISLDAELVESVRRGKGKTKFIFIFSEGHVWQGLDKIINIINELEKSCLYIVGRKDRLGQMGIAAEQLPGDKFFLLGTRNFGELKYLYNNVDFAFGSFAWERVKMKEAVPLKVREYLYFGLPVIIGYNDPQLKGALFIHNYQDMEKLRGFLAQPFDRESIRNYTKKYLSWRTILTEMFTTEPTLMSVGPGTKDARQGM